GPPGVGSAHACSSRMSRVSSWVCQGREVCAAFGSLMELDATEVLGAHVAVLAGTDQSGGRAMMTVERTAVEALGDEDVLGQGVVRRAGSLVGVEPAKDTWVTDASR